MPLAASKCSTMTVVPARRQGGRISKQKSGHNIHIQNYGNLCIGVATGMTKGHPIDRGRMFSPEKEGMGFDGAVGGGSTESSGSDVSRARPKGYGVRIANAAPQHSSSSEALAHAIVRGFRVGAARKLPEFLERRASPCNATAENMVGIKKVLTCTPCSLFFFAVVGVALPFWSQFAPVMPLLNYPNFEVTTGRRCSHHHCQSGRSPESHWNKWRLICWNALDDSTLPCKGLST